MERYTYTYTPTVQQAILSMCQYLFETAQQDKESANNIYCLLSGAIHNSDLEEDYKKWWKSQIDAAIRSTIKM